MKFREGLIVAGSGEISKFDFVKGLSEENVLLSD